MPRSALRCSNEQLAPNRLLHSIQRAEEAGFAWRFLGAALSEETGRDLGPVIDALGEHVLPGPAA